MCRILAVVIVVCLVASSFSSVQAGSDANRTATQDIEYDYKSLAVASVLTSAAEAAKIPDIPQRVRLLIRAAKTFPATQRDEAVRLLEGALRDLKDWGSDDKVSWFQRHTTEGLRNEVLAALATLDPQKAALAQKTLQAEADSTAANGAESMKQNNWLHQFSDRRAVADQSAKIALSLVDTDVEKSAALIARSLQGGTVSQVLPEIVRKLVQDGNRASLNRIETVIVQQLAQSVTLDPFSVAFAVSLSQSDKDLPPAARSAFVSFFIRSVQAWSNALKEPGIDSSYITTGFTIFSITVRPAILQSSPEQLLVFDLALNEAAPLVPERTRLPLQAFQPETFSEPRDRLNDILKDPNPERRDLRLIGLVAQLLRNESEDAQKSLDLASDAISGFTDPDFKSAYTDLLTTTRVNALVKQKKFIEAQRLAGSISSEETRAWALLALSTVATKADRVLGFELISNALTTLDKTSPSPHKVELALIATGMLAKSDPQRAFETLSAASRYANSSAAKVDPPAKPAVAFGLDANIGEAHTKLGVFPESLGDVQIDPSVSTLGTNDWFRANQIVDGIREPALRLRLKLEFARAMLAEGPKPKKKETTKKPSAKN